MRPFKRITEHEMVGGVACGLAYALEWPTWVIRLLWLLLALGCGTGVLTYLLCWILMPAWSETPKDYLQVCEPEE